MLILLGNAAPHEVLDDEDAARRGLDLDSHQPFDAGKVVVPYDAVDAVTTIGPFPDDMSLVDALTAVTKTWGYHSSEPPVWVAADSTALASLVAEQYGCEIREVPRAD